MESGTDTKESLLTDIFTRQGISSRFDCLNTGGLIFVSDWLLCLKKGEEEKTFKCSSNKRKLPKRAPLVNFPDGQQVFIPKELNDKGYKWGEALPHIYGPITVYEETLRKLSVPETPNLLDAMESIVYECSIIYDYTYEEYCEEIGAYPDRLSHMNYYIEICGYMVKFRSLGISMQELFDIFA
jgi:hypothetical protein